MIRRASCAIRVWVAAQSHLRVPSTGSLQASASVIETRQVTQRNPTKSNIALSCWRCSGKDWACS